MQKYTSTMTEAFYNIKHAGVTSGACVVSKAENKANGEIVKIYLDVKNKKVEKISFLTSGSIVLCVSLDALCEKVSGRPVNEIEKLSERDVVEALQQLNKKDLGEATFAVQSIKKAYALYNKKQANGTLQERESKTRAITPSSNISVYVKQVTIVETTETTVEQAQEESLAVYDENEVVTTANVDELTKPVEQPQQNSKKPAKAQKPAKTQKKSLFATKKTEKKVVEKKVEKAKVEKPVKAEPVKEEKPATEKPATAVIIPEQPTNAVVIPEEQPQASAVVVSTKTTTTTTVETKKSTKKSEEKANEEAETMVKSVGGKKKAFKEEPKKEEKVDEPQTVSAKITQDGNQTIIETTTVSTGQNEVDEIDAITENLSNAISQLNFKFDDEPEEEQTSKKSKKK